MSRMAEASEPEWDDTSEAEEWEWEYAAFLDYIDACNERIEDAKEKDNG